MESDEQEKAEVADIELGLAGPDDLNGKDTSSGGGETKGSLLVDEDWNRQRLNLFDEAHDMLKGAFLMFCIPDLRAFAKRGHLEGPEEMIQRIIDLPASLFDLHTIYALNKERLTAEALNDPERADFYEQALGLESVKALDKDVKEAAMKENRVVCFDDVDEEHQCVYGISVNRLSQRVNVFFRGSVTRTDFKKDAKVDLSAIPNPIKADHLADELGVHFGFRDYLYHEEDYSKVAYTPMLHLLKREKQEIDDKQMKYQIILDQVRKLLAECPGYRVYIGGHSLGGALATMLALEAAADEAITKDFPVTCITSGAPKVGNLDFLLAFEELEKQKKLRCVHLANDQDPVSRSPPNGAFSPLAAMLFQERRYRYVGLRVKLVKLGYVIEYHPRTRTYCGILLFDEILIGKAWLLTIFYVCFFIIIPMVRKFMPVKRMQ